MRYALTRRNNAQTCAHARPRPCRHHCRSQYRRARRQAATAAIARHRCVRLSPKLPRVRTCAQRAERRRTATSSTQCDCRPVDIRRDRTQRRLLSPQPLVRAQTVSSGTRSGRQRVPARSQRQQRTTAKAPFAAAGRVASASDQVIMQTIRRRRGTASDPVADAASRSLAVTTVRPLRSGTAGFPRRHNGVDRPQRPPRRYSPAGARYDTVGATLWIVVVKDRSFTSALCTM